MKLLVHKSRNLAGRAIKLLGLDPLVWEPWGYRDALMGWRWDEIVVILSTRPTTHDLEWMQQDLALKLPPGKKVEFL